MNLEDVIDENGLQQDEWSLTKPTFGEEGQLEVVGWSGKNWSAKYYILKCNKCSQDSELFGEGIFRSKKNNLISGQVPCGCSKKRGLTEDQWHVILNRSITGTTYEILEHYQDNKRKQRLVDIKCSVCSDDLELYEGGVFTTTASRLESRLKCCGCSDRYQYTERQCYVRCTRTASSKGYVFNGWVGEYHGFHTKIDIECPKHGVWNTTTANSLLSNGTGCPRCAKELTAPLQAEAKTTPESDAQEMVLEVCTQRGFSFKGFVGAYRGTRSKVLIQCNKHPDTFTPQIRTLLYEKEAISCLSCKDDASIEELKRNPAFAEGSNFWRQEGNNEKIGYRLNWKLYCGECKVTSSTTLTRLNKGHRPCCGRTKTDDRMIQSFLASGAFHPDTKFWRSDREDARGYRKCWFMYCPKCSQTGETQAGNLQRGAHPCACSKQRQQECYINWLVDEHENAVAIKFGIANNSKQRIKSQDRQSAYEVRQYQVYSFPSVADCKQAERECKKELECGVVLKRDMPDGWTETTWSYNIGKVKSIYERNGGILV